MPDMPPPGDGLGDSVGRGSASIFETVSFTVKSTLGDAAAVTTSFAGGPGLSTPLALSEEVATVFS